MNSTFINKDTYMNGTILLASVKLTSTPQPQCGLFVKSPGTLVSGLGSKCGSDGRMAVRRVT